MNEMVWVMAWAMAISLVSLSLSLSFVLALLAWRWPRAGSRIAEDTIRNIGEAYEKGRFLEKTTREKIEYELGVPGTKPVAEDDSTLEDLNKPETVARF